MEELKIHLTYNPDYFKEIYYQNGQGNIFTYKATRKVIFIPVVLILLTIIIYILSYRMPAIAWLIGLGIVAILLMGIYALVAILKYVKWKNNTETFITDISQHKSNLLQITENAIELVQDSTINIIRWESVSSTRIEKNYILIKSENEILFLFPEKSMKAEEYEQLIGIIRQKLK